MLDFRNIGKITIYYFIRTTKYYIIVFVGLIKVCVYCPPYPMESHGKDLSRIMMT